MTKHISCNINSNNNTYIHKEEVGSGEMKLFNRLNCVTLALVSNLLVCCTYLPVNVVAQSGISANVDVNGSGVSGSLQTGSGSSIGGQLSLGSGNGGFSGGQQGGSSNSGSNGGSNNLLPSLSPPSDQSAGGALANGGGGSSNSGGISGSSGK